MYAVCCVALRVNMKNLTANRHYKMFHLTLKVPVTTIDAQWKGMGDVGSARYEPALGFKLQ